MMKTPAQDPFISYEHDGETLYYVDVTSRLAAIKTFNATQCVAALGLHDLQKTVRTAAERRLRALARENTARQSAHEAAQFDRLTRANLEAR